MNALRITRLAFRAGIQEFLLIWGWQSWISGWMINVLAQIAFFSLLGKLLDSPERLHYLLIGNAIAAGLFQTNVAVAVSTWDRGDGTYPLLVISPSSLIPAILGRTASWLIGGVATTILALVLIHFIFDVPMAWPGALLAPALILVACGSSFFTALVLGSIVTRMPRTRNIVHRILTTTIMAFCGVSVPLSFWPGWVETVANVLPVTHGLQAIRDLLDGAAAAVILENVAFELLVGLGWLTVAILVIDRMADAGRRDGSIDMV